MKKELDTKKPVLIGGVVMVTISLCIIFPYESSKTNYITELPFTFLSLALAMFTLMFGLMGKHFFKGLLFLVFSAFFSFLCWCIFYYDILGVIPAIYAGIPAGIVAGLLFLIFNYQWIKNEENKTRLFLKRLLLYSAVLFTSSILFAKGGDWIFELTEYFKGN